MLDEFLDFSQQLLVVWIQADKLTHNFTFGIQQGDEIGMGKLALCIPFEFHAKDSGQIEHIVRAAAEERPGPG